MGSANAQEGKARFTRTGQNVKRCQRVFKWKAYGLDFGFTNDPTALIEVMFQEGKLWVRELIYETGLTNADITHKCGLQRSRMRL
jgi:phage terminase large subunit